MLTSSKRAFFPTRNVTLFACIMLKPHVFCVFGYFGYSYHYTQKQVFFKEDGFETI